DVERLSHRPTSWRRSLRAGAIAPVSGRRRLLRVLDGNTAGDADAVPGGAGGGRDRRRPDADQGRARLALGPRISPHLRTALRGRELPLWRAGTAADRRLEAPGPLRRGDRRARGGNRSLLIVRLDRRAPLLAPAPDADRARPVGVAGARAGRIRDRPQ